MDIYFQIRGWGSDREKYSIDYQPYLLPRQKYLKGTGIEFDLFGKRYHFKWTKPDQSVMIPDTELPKDFVYSFKHGLGNIRRSCSKEEFMSSVAPTKEEILEAISQTSMYKREDVLSSQKYWKEVYKLNG